MTAREHIRQSLLARQWSIPMQVILDDLVECLNLLPATEQRPSRFTRIGGRPNLPPGTTWPNMTTRRKSWSLLKGRQEITEQQPLAFLAQLDCAEINRLDLDAPFPNQGAIFFFFHPEGKATGRNAEDATGWKVIYHPGTPESNPETPYPRTLANRARYPEYPAYVDLGYTYHDDERDPLPLTDEEYDHYMEITDLFDGNQLLGDPLSIYNSLYFLPCFSGEQPVPLAREERTDWVLLLQLDSTPLPASPFGVDGILTCWITEADLKACRFDRVWFNLDEAIEEMILGR